MLKLIEICMKNEIVCDIFRSIFLFLLGSTHSLKDKEENIESSLGPMNSLFIFSSKKQICFKRARAFDATSLNLIDTI